MTAFVQNHSTKSRLSSGAIWLLLGIALIVGGFVRFESVVDLSFYGDEETTAFAARSVIESGHPQMPSGMAYNRAPLYSYMAAASASVFGLDAEFSYRLPALVFGLLAIVALFLGTRHFFGTAIALACGLLLTTSEWHVITSGYARMYSPYLALFLLAAFGFLDWQRNRRVPALLFALLFFFLTASFQILAVFATGLLLLPYLLKREIDNRQLLQDISIAAVINGIVIYLDATLVQTAYSSFAVAVDGDHKSTVLTNVDTFWIPLALQLTSGWPLIIAAIGSACIGGLAWRWRKSSWLFLLGFTGIGIFTACMLALGQLYSLLISVYLSIVLLRSHGFSWRIVATYALPLIALTLVIALLNPAGDFRTMLANPSEQFVFPYLAFFFFKYPIIAALALIAPFLSLPKPLASEQIGQSTLSSTTKHSLLPATFSATLPSTLALFFVFNFMLFGLLGQWYEDRYTAHAYPFALMLATYSAAVLIQRVRSRSGALGDSALAAAIIVAACLVMPHHLVQGVYNSLTREHGSLNIENRRYFPDHASVGRFVRERLQPGDSVVATDVLQQRWYVGQADYWLRSVADVAGFIYQLPNREVRDVYVHSRHVDTGLADSLLSSTDRVWVIDSSVDQDKDWAFSSLEKEFLQEVANRGELLYTGRDNQAKVYLLQANQ